MLTTLILIGTLLLLTKSSSIDPTVVVLNKPVTYGEYVDTCRMDGYWPINIGKANIRSAMEALGVENLKVAWIGSHDYWGVPVHEPFVLLRSVDGKPVPDGLSYLGEDNLEKLATVTLRPMCSRIPGILDSNAETSTAYQNETTDKVQSEKGAPEANEDVVPEEYKKKKVVNMRFRTNPGNENLGSNSSD